MKKIFCLTVAFTLTLCWYSCQKPGNAYIDANAPAPMPVSNLKVKNTPGGAVISYQVPNDSNLLYVKAVYEIQKGVSRLAKSSHYIDTLPLVGFGDTLSHEVKIYSVGRNEKESAPLSIQVTPLTPPIKSVLGTLTLDAAFGGVSVTFKNPAQADLAIHIIMDTTGLNTWTTLTTYYTNEVEGDFAARGLDTIQRRFGVYITDHWNNISDTLERSLSPLYEILIPKNLFKEVHLPGDFWDHYQNFTLSMLYDGINYDGNNAFISNDGTTLPKWVTIDMGQKVLFSRMKLWQWNHTVYSASWQKSFEIWGSNSPDPDGGWNNWELLGHFTANPPSGLPWPQYTAADLVYEQNGEDYTFPQFIPAVRYIRFKLLFDYDEGVTGYIAIGELSFWGQPEP